MKDFYVELLIFLFIIFVVGAIQIWCCLKIAKKCDERSDING